MSTTVIVPPPNSSSLLRRVPRLTSQARALLTAMNLHFAGVAALAVLDLYLLIHLAFVWQALSARNPDAIDQQRVMVRSAELAARPLRGLDQKLVTSTAKADGFYQERLPNASSDVIAEEGALAHRESVHWTRAQYSYEPVLSGSPYELTEMHTDASISGDYRPVVQFINAVERDKLFFVITGVSLSGEQTGQVNLRIRLTTYLRTPVPQEETGEPPAAQINPAPAPNPAAAPPPGGAQ